MRRSHKFCSLSMVFAVTNLLMLADAESEQHSLSVPAKYEGIWIRAEGKDDQCKATDFQAHDNERLVGVYGHTLKMFESSCNITSVTFAKKPITAQDFLGGPVRLSLQCSGEGENWDAREFWTLKRIGDSDTLITINDATSTLETYVRCH